MIILLAISFLLIEIENQLKSIIPPSGLIAIMFASITINQKYTPLANRLQNKYNKLWIISEIILFVLVGTAVNIKFALNYGIVAFIIVILALVFRSFGVFVSLLNSKLNTKEKIFCIISYIPKATVQAAIGTIPFQIGLNCGNIALTIAVLAILITAPIGAFFIDNLSNYLLD